MDKTTRRIPFGWFAVLAAAFLFTANLSFSQLEIEPGGGAGGGGTVGTACSGDSSSFTLANGASCTTSVVDIKYRRFPDCATVGIPYIVLRVASNMASGDSLSLVTQYSNDLVSWGAKAAVNVLNASPVDAVILTCDTFANQPAMGFRYFRWIISDNDVSRTAAYPNMSLSPSFLESKQ